MQRVAIKKLVPKTIIFCCLVPLVPLSGYGQDLVREEYELTDNNKPLLINWNANRNPLLSRDSKAQFNKLFDHKPKPTRLVGLVPLMASVPHVGHPSHGPISNVSWPTPSLNTAVLPPKTVSHRADRGKSGTNRWIAGLVGAGLTGAGVYLMATSDGPNPIKRLCTLCSEPPTSNIHLRLTGQQGAGLVSILAGVGFLYYAIAPD